MDQQTKPGKIRARASIDAVKTHGPNSPDVLSGKVPVGFQETVQVENPVQVIELDYSQAVVMFGKEKADELFKGVADD